MSALDFDFGPLEPLAAPPSASDAYGVMEIARREAASIRDAARAEGFAAGHREAREAIAPAVTALEEVSREARERGLGTAERLEAEAVQLAFAVAEQVIGARVAADPGLVVDALRGALRGLVEREHVTVLVHPDDLELVRHAGDALMAALGGIEHWEVQAERRMGRGGAIVHYRDGLIDASHAAKLEQARAVVHEQLSSAGDP